MEARGGKPARAPTDSSAGGGRTVDGAADALVGSGTAVGGSGTAAGGAGAAVNVFWLGADVEEDEEGAVVPLAGAPLLAAHPMAPCRTNSQIAEAVARGCWLVWSYDHAPLTGRCARVQLPSVAKAGREYRGSAPEGGRHNSLGGWLAVLCGACVGRTPQAYLGSGSPVVAPEPHPSRGVAAALWPW
jgi:hypothetical protein